MVQMNTSSILFQIVFFLCVAAVLFGCDSTELDPFNNEGQYFTIYGFLDQSTNFTPGASHAVRVVPITRRAEVITTPFEPQATIDARVFSIDTLTGQEIEWSQRLVQLDNDQYGHVFEAGLFVLEGRTYRLEVRRSDGVMTTAETTVPRVSSINLEQLDPVLSADSTSVTREIIIPRVRSIWGLNIIYRLGDPSCFGASFMRVPYTGPVIQDEIGVRFTVDIIRDTGIQPDSPEPGQFLCAMGLEANVPDANWNISQSESSLDTLAFSNVQSNVTNGFGFWGSLALLQLDWPVDEALGNALGQ